MGGRGLSGRPAKESVPLPQGGVSLEAPGRGGARTSCSGRRQVALHSGGSSRWGRKPPSGGRGREAPLMSRGQETEILAHRR